MRARAVMLAAALCCVSPTAWACRGAPLASETREDLAGRAVAPVFVNGEGPFRFIIDTGANRSVLSAGLAARLGIVAHTTGEVHSVTGVETAPLASVASLTMGALSMSGANLPLLDGPMLAGQHGVLGFDGMAGRRLYIDFARNCVEITPSQGADALDGWLSVDGQVRFGALMVARGAIHGVGVNVLIDTGSNISLANPAFRDSLQRVRAQYVEYHGDRAFTAGRPVFLDDAVWAPRIRLGDTVVSNVIAYVGDYHIFHLWGLADEPTVLLGVDVLAQSGAMAIDYERRTVHFRRAPRGLW